MSIQAIFDRVVAMDEDGVLATIQSELAAGTDPAAILNDGLISAMDKVGELFSAGDIFVPEMLMAAEAMKSGVEMLKPHLVAGTSRDKGRVVIGTVKGDLHDIGKNLVVMMLESAGFQVFDLGVDVEVASFVAEVQARDAQVIALSALLSTTMLSMEKTVKAIKDAGLKTKVIVGGAPVTRDFATRIGADGYGDDAPGAVKLVKELLA